VIRRERGNDPSDVPLSLWIIGIVYLVVVITAIRWLT
jgi:hypothetical protein